MRVQYMNDVCNVRSTEIGVQFHLFAGTYHGGRLWGQVTAALWVPRCTASQTEGQTDRRPYHDNSRSFCDWL